MWVQPLCEDIRYWRHCAKLLYSHRACLSLFMMWYLKARLINFTLIHYHPSILASIIWNCWFFADMPWLHRRVLPAFSLFAEVLFHSVSVSRETSGPCTCLKKVWYHWCISYRCTMRTSMFTTYTHNVAFLAPFLRKFAYLAILFILHLTSAAYLYRSGKNK